MLDNYHAKAMSKAIRAMVDAARAAGDDNLVAELRSLTRRMAGLFELHAAGQAGPFNTGRFFRYCGFGEG